MSKHAAPKQTFREVEAEQRTTVPEVVYVDEPIYPEQVAYFGIEVPWVLPGRYKVRREFDKTRYMIELKAPTPTNIGTVTLIKKGLTRVLA